MKKPAADPLKLSWDEVGYLAQGLSFASRPFRAAIRDVTSEHGLGPRGAWIVQLIGTGQVVYPLDLTNFFRIGRSLITAELARLTEAKLITYRKRTDDRRRVELALTPLGEKVQQRVKEELAKLILERFSTYSREQVLLLGRMLHDFIFSEPASVRTRGGRKPQARAAAKKAKRS